MKQPAVRSARSLLGPLALILAALSLAVVPALAEESRVERSVAKDRAKIAEIWLDLAEDLAAKGVKDKALEALERAKAADAEVKNLAKVEAAVKAVEATVEPDAAATKKIDKAFSDVARRYDKIARKYEKAEDRVGELQAAMQAFRLDPSKKRTTALVKRGQKHPLLLVSPTHPAAAYVSFPKDWKPGKSYEVLVSVDGAGANFMGNAKAFSSRRASRPFITVAPHALSCTNAIDESKFPAYSKELISEWNGRRVDFDVPGLLAMLDFLHERFGAKKEIAITGFSGGGNLCYGFTLRHPDRVKCAAPACANFIPSLADGAPTVEGGGPQVHVMTGEKDPHRHLTHGKSPPGIETQTDWAMEAFKKHGFTNVKRTMLPGVGHSNLVTQVWGFIDEIYGE